MGGQNAYLTVYLALCMTLILSLYLVLIEGARQNGARLESACAAEIGMQSILAEYHRELLEQYNLFAIDSSYGTEISGRKNTEDHLMHYVEKNLGTGASHSGNYVYRDFFGLSATDARLTKVSVLTDGGGAVFRRCAIDAVRDDMGLQLLEDLQEWMHVIEINGLDRTDVEEEKKQLDESLEEYNGMEVQVSDTESVLVDLENPTARLEAKKNLGILYLVIEDKQAISENRIRQEKLIMNRMHSGQVTRGDVAVESADGITDRFLFQEYLLRYMGHYGSEREEDALKYQVEYLLAGRESDVDNLKSAANRLFAFREAANVLYLLKDAEKNAEVKALATALGGFLPIPGLLQLIEAVILFGWASAESIHDVKVLLNGGKVPLVKDGATWHYSLESALRGELTDGPEGGEGLSYEDYLRIFMMLTNLDTLTARAMNVVEADIRMTAGNAAFRMDVCYDRLEAEVWTKSSFGCEYRIMRTGTYH